MSSKTITFIVPGHAQTVDGRTRGATTAPLAPPAGMRGRIKQSVVVGAQRAPGGEVRVNAVPGEDVVVLHIAGGPALTLHPENARDLILAQGEVTRGRGPTGADEPAPDEVEVPAQFRWRGLEQGVPTRGASRGFLGDVVLSGVDVITDLVTDVAADFVASEVVKRVDAQVDEGVYALNADVLTPLKGAAPAVQRVPVAPDGGPLLIFVHGTFSNTSGTFAKLWTHHPQRVRSLFKEYGSRVYALDHATLGVSPIANAVTLAQALPRNARIHLVTHSRGGLVAEVLSQICASPDDDFKPFRTKGYAEQRQELMALAALVKERKIHVDRLVRVACPARGTLLASKRLDAYVSVFKWTLELAGIPVAPALVDFLGAVAQRRADPELLPGLAAQIPDSPLVQWLHAVDRPIAGDLRVVAGDLEGDSVTSWLKTLLADAFYWTDNDLVVQTRSMYGGGPRASGATFALDQGGKVSHFNYFSNDRTADAIVDALLQKAPQGFRTIGPLSWKGESSTGLRAARRDDGTPANEKPAVFVLPGILGSNLKVDGERIWLGWRLVNGLQRLDYTPGKGDRVEPDGTISGVYDALIDFLSNTHEVVEFAFDWRRPIEDEASRLATAVEAALAAREKSSQPVRLVAHSMGGLVARCMQLERPDVWQRMMARRGARILMLGTPNDGSWAPMQVLSGDDTFGNTLANVGAPFQDNAARALMARFPGFIQLQAGLLDDTLGLAKRDTWQRLANDDVKRVREQSWWHNVALQLNAVTWGVPPQEVLDRAVALRKRLDAQRDNDLGSFKDKLLLVVGLARFTPAGYGMGSDGLFYLNAPDAGDGRVTRQSAVLPGVRTWTLDCDHGGLPNRRAGFAAYLELLQTGTTNLLDPLTVSAVRSAGVTTTTAVPARSRPARSGATSRPPEDDSELLSVDPRGPLEEPTERGTALRITVTNGDLTFVRQPLLLGHYRSSRLTGTERVMNGLVGGAMEVSLRMGLYPVPPGTHQVFVNTRVDSSNPWQAPRPEAVIVVGLGEEGKLRGSDLVHTVRQAVIAWAQRMAEKHTAAPQFFELASTLMGSGGAGITVAQSAQLIAQGVREANERLDDDSVRDRKWPRVGHLHLIELYLDRATEAWRAVQMQATATPERYVVSDVVQSGVAALRRPLDSGYRGADYDFITAESVEGPRGEGVIAYTLDTKRARTEVRAQATQLALLRDLVASASNDKNTDTQIGRTLFRLLVPVEMEPFFGGTTEMQLELDRGTAGIPWELLDTDTPGSRDSQPWGIRAKLLRKLQTADFRGQVTDADAEASVLVIGEPECDPTMYRRLSGAREEAKAVAARLTAPSALGIGRVKSLISPDDPTQFGANGRTVINALMERDWRIVHIAGHGEPSEKIGPVPTKPDDPPQKDGAARGVVLSNGAFLGPNEVRNMRTIPELVFVNCCYLAARNTGQLLASDDSDCGRPYNRPQFASGVAEELIKLGVRCVIAAGWAVEDGPALVFATTFYDAVLRGRRFIDAVGEAREVAHAMGGNTWAAYQCYGDPDWTFRRVGADPQRPQEPLVDEFAGVASPRGLMLALETLAIRSKFRTAFDEDADAKKRYVEDQQARIRHLEARFAPLWGGIGEVAEAFAVAWAQAGDTKTAINWYDRALGANDGTASMKAAEQRANLQVRAAWEVVEKAQKRRDDLKQSRATARKGRTAAPSNARTAAGRELAAAQRALADAVRAARTQVSESILMLNKLVALQPSMERESLCGSTYKRLALIEAVAGRRPQETAAIRRMKLHYGRAEKLAQKGRLPDFFYPAMNRMAAELIINAARDGWTGVDDAAAVAAVRKGLATKVRDDPDFWSVVGQTELRVYESVARGDLAKNLASIEAEYQDLHDRVSAEWMWASVYDQARFVLPKYAERASPAERKAAAALLKFLEW